ncbi:MAG: ATP-binding protein [Candidatus Omnitrophota bacterium]
MGLPPLEKLILSEEDFIFILSDDGEFIESIGGLLKPVYKFSVVRDINTAAAELEKNKPILAVLDVASYAPALYGVCKELVVNLNKKYVVIYLLMPPSQDENQEIREIKELSDCVVTKPVDYPELLRKINSSVRFRKLEQEMVIQDKILYLLNEEKSLEDLDITKTEIKKYALNLVKQFRELAESTLARERQKSEELKESREKLQESNEQLQSALKDLKNTQAQLIQSEKLAAIGQLAAGVAHELNSPLGGIISYAQFMVEKITKKGVSNIALEDAAKYAGNLKKIELAAERCKNIVANLLNFARSSNDEQTHLKMLPLSITQVLNDTLVLLEYQLSMNNVTIKKQIKENLPLVIGDKFQIQQVFTNLILNAQQAMPKGGAITISTRQNENREIEISFADTGCGIAEENMSRLFTPFFTTKQIGEGTGLGLSVSYSIIRKHNGRIFVESKLGEGSRFCIILPPAKNGPQ